MNKKFAIVFISLLIILTGVVYAANFNDSYADSNGNINISNKEIDNDKTFFSGNIIKIDNNFDSSVTVLGTSIELNGNYNGDVIVLGSDVKLKGNYSGNVFILCNQASVYGNISGNLYSLTNFIDLYSNYDKDVFLFSNSANFDSESHIGRDLFAFGNTFTYDGNINRNAKLMVSSNIINSKISGNITLYCDTLQINDNSVIEGKLVYNSPEDNITISDKAVLSEQPIWKPLVSNSKNYTATDILFSLLGTALSIIIIWFLIKTFSPNFFNKCGKMVKSRWLEAIALGAASIIIIVLISIPIFFISLSLGLAISFIYTAILIISQNIALVVFSVALAENFNSANNSGYALSICTVTLAYSFIIMIPTASTIISIILTLFGIGFIIDAVILNRKEFIKNERMKPPFSAIN